MIGLNSFAKICPRIDGHEHKRDGSHKNFQVGCIIPRHLHFFHFSNQ